MSTASRMMELFAGLDRAHGRFTIKNQTAKGKMVGRASTELSPPTLELWTKHLSGEQGIGIVPIMDSDSCWWGCLDIDDHSVDLPGLEKKIIKLNLPLVLARSKSGGAHCFLFMAEPCEARTMRDALIEWSAALGFGGCEVFPKQVQLAKSEDGKPQDVGNWLNMPYFDARRTMRYGLNLGEAMSCTDFLDLAFSTRVTVDELLSVEMPMSDALEGGPPCLQLLIAQGFPEGTRNEALFNLGVYCRMRYDDWEDKLEDLNHAVMDPPLKSAEVQTLIKSLKRKDYFYRCGEPPLRPVCNKSKCLRCKFGVGDAGGVDVSPQGLTLVKTSPPVWFVDVDGVRMQLETMDLLNQDRFRKRCMETICKLPSKRKMNDWDKMVSELLESRTEVEAPDDAGPVGLFWSHLYRYCEAGAHQARSKEDLLEVSKVWKDDGRLFFRSPGLLAYLDRQHFRDFAPHQIWALLRGGHNGGGGSDHHAIRIQGTCVQCWSIPVFDTPVGDREIPELPEKEEEFE